MSQHINPDRQNNINEILNKTKNITIRKVLKYHTVREAPKSNRNLETESKSIPRTHMIVHFPGLEKVLE